MNTIKITHNENVLSVLEKKKRCLIFSHLSLKHCCVNVSDKKYLCNRHTNSKKICLFFNKNEKCMEKCSENNEFLCEFHSKDNIYDNIYDYIINNFNDKSSIENNQEKDVVTERPEVAEAEKVVEERSLEADNNAQEVVPKSIEEVKDEASAELLEQQKRLSKYKKCYNCNLAGSDFSGKNLDGADLEGSDFTGANLEKADFENANLKGVSFRNANLKSAKFNKADLYKADFTGADLTGAEFNKALIDETNFQDTVGYGSLMINQPE